jgi:hypothetical protein
VKVSGMEALLHWRTYATCNLPGTVASGTALSQCSQQMMLS